MNSQADLMSERYGKKPVDSVRQRKIVIALASTLVALFVIWAISTTMTNANQIVAKSTGYEVLNSGQTKVNFNVILANDKDTATCAVQALSESYSVVGYVEVEIPAGGSGNYETIVKTTELAVTGQVDKCWLK